MDRNGCCYDVRLPDGRYVGALHLVLPEDTHRLDVRCVPSLSGHARGVADEPLPKIERRTYPIQPFPYRWRGRLPDNSPSILHVERDAVVVDCPDALRGMEAFCVGGDEPMQPRALAGEVCEMMLSKLPKPPPSRRGTDSFGDMADQRIR